MWSVSKATTQTQFQKLHQKALTMSELFLKKYTWPSLKAKLKTSNGTSIEISKIRFGEKLAKLKIKHLYSIRNKKEKQRVNFLIHKDLKKKKKQCGKIQSYFKSHIQCHYMALKLVQTKHHWHLHSHLTVNQEGVREILQLSISRYQWSFQYN